VNLKQYYRYYLTLHQNQWCRRLHICGQLATIFFIIYSTLTNAWLLLLSPFIVYPFAWSGHYFFEKNKPAAFKEPIKAKICDWIMFKDIMLGKIKL